MDWYYADGEERIGPLSESRFDALVHAGTISDETLVWHEGMTAWVPYASATGQTVTSASNTGEKRDFDSGYAANESYTASLDVSGVKYGGFWIRFVAKIIDYVVVFVVWVTSVVLLILFPGSIDTASEDAAIAIFGLRYYGIPAAVYACYNIWFIGRFGATPGKMAVGIKVLRADGRSVTYGRAFVRHIFGFLSSILLWLGYIIAAFDAKKRALHDHLCDTRVVVSRQ